LQYPLSNFAKKCAGGWIDSCPAHDDKNPSLSIKETSDGVLLLKCFAGCSFEQIIEAAGLKCDRRKKPWPAENAYALANAKTDLNNRISMAKNIWQGTLPLLGSLAQSYLNSRRIGCWSDDIRFHPNLYNSKIEAEMPAMVCAIRRDRQFVGVHRTFLSPTGEKLNKMMLGDCKGGAVHLGGSGRLLIISEGVENGLAVRQMSSLVQGTFLAAMSATNLGSCKLPSEPATLVIAADDDQTGKLEALKLGQRAADHGWRASTLFPPAPGDWNDYLRRGD
jgi:hypothetical protein